MVVDAQGAELEARHLSMPDMRSLPPGPQRACPDRPGGELQPPPTRPHEVRARGARGRGAPHPGGVAPIEQGIAAAGRALEVRMDDAEGGSDQFSMDGAAAYSSSVT